MVSLTFGNSFFDSEVVSPDTFASDLFSTNAICSNENTLINYKVEIMDISIVYIISIILEVYNFQLDSK